MFVVGDRVNNKSGYGTGVITKIEREFVTVKFDINSCEIAMHFKVLSLIESFNHSLITIGATVEYNDKIGKVIALDGDYVAIDFGTGKKDILLKKLIHVIPPIEEEEILLDEEDEDELSDNENFKILPENYSTQACFSTSSKELMTWAKKHFEKGYMAIESFEKTEDNEEEIVLSNGVIVLNNTGVVVFTIINSYDDPNEFCDDIAFLEKKYQFDKEKIISKFLDSKKLCTFVGEKKIQSFPLKYVYVFQKITAEKFSLIKRRLDKINPNFYFRNFKSDNELLVNFEPCSSSFTKIKDEWLGNILERVVPFYTLWNGKIEEVKTPNENVTGEFKKITGSENEYSALHLDDEQINFINNTKKGNWLTLANPGTGKSVILLSKAHRLISQDEKTNVLITCFNRNLCDNHIWNSELFGLKTKNLNIFTFHKMVQEILLHKFHITIEDNVFEDYSKFDKYVDLLINKIDSGELKPLFDAIFIDEVQLIAPLWIKLCYKLLKNDGYFELYGDLNQDLNSLKRKGQASWQDKTILKFNWQGRTRYFERNYRNTDLIAGYLNLLISTLNNRLKALGMKMPDEESSLKSQAFRKGRRRVQVFSKKDKPIGDRVYNIVRQMTEKDFDYSEIAIILPVRKYKDYTPLEDIEKKFKEMNVPYSLICGKIEERTQLSKVNGIIITTIDSALGLDFKSVIFCGTKYFHNFWDEQNIRHVFKPDVFLNEKYKQVALHNYCEKGRKIYAACSRAKECLVILDDLPEDSEILKILLPEEGEKYYAKK